MNGGGCSLVWARTYATPCLYELLIVVRPFRHGGEWRESRAHSHAGRAVVCRKMYWHELAFCNRDNDLQAAFNPECEPCHHQNVCDSRLPFTVLHVEDRIESSGV